MKWWSSKIGLIFRGILFIAIGVFLFSTGGENSLLGPMVFRILAVVIAVLGLMRIIQAIRG
jgi:hypothetical protein